MKTVAAVFGTRPEIIKLAPVLDALASRPGIGTRAIHTGQHDELARAMLEEFRVRPDRDLGVMADAVGPSAVLARTLERLAPLLASERPDFLLVQGDTSSALAGAMAGFYGGVPVGHVEAGLRSGDARNPFPEEMNRRLVSRLATLHFAATERNRRALLDEGVDAAAVHVTGNPIVDALEMARGRARASGRVGEILARAGDRRLLVLTTHRRESFGETMAGNLAVLARFVAENPDVALVFPVHPNPRVVEAARAALGSADRVHLVDPLPYGEFLELLSRAWLVVSDSGGIQEEVPSLGTPLVVLRRNTERPEAIEAGFARLTGGDPARLGSILEDATAWVGRVAIAANPFGDGRAGERIAEILARHFAQERDQSP